MDKHTEEQITQVIHGRIETHTMEDGTRVFPIETDNQSMGGSGMSDIEAWEDLVRSADQVGWRLEE